MSTETLVELPSLEFVAPFPGFPGKTRFALVALDEAGMLYALRSLDDPSLRFLVVPPAPFFPEYTPEVDDVTAAMLGLSRAEQALLLLVLNPGDAPGTATANLLAPIVVNIESRQAAQVVLAGNEYDVRAPLTAA
ncbi:MAG TPA: flagellar assembly protein FliW [Mycobacteriales bacterium]|jgi:flagellar assembly factor FliW|nr:flagellar assembly protein FliW [Mycobacteriales bacterium]